MSELFLENNKLELNDFSEADVLHDIWTFLCRAFKSKETNASLRERASGDVALARNEHRGLGAREKRPRKAIGAKLGIVFKIGYNEHGSCEVGKDDVTVADDKYLDNSLIKLPKTLRDMMALLVQKNIRKINTLLTVGFLVMDVMSTIDDPNIVLETLVNHSSYMKNKPLEKQPTENKKSTTSKPVKVASKRTNADYSINQRTTFIDRTVIILTRLKETFFLHSKVKELGFSEAGKDTVLPIDEKYLNDGLLKLLKTLRDIFTVFVETNPSRISQLVSVGFLVMGKEKIKW
ncbi:hypothetical protein INT48_006627 [Thamnidium elegans]|uniref:Uncharacterized protein n=1 Tax=Thamnidium elegans TaxID=101142 RepID=A0A8H7SZT5_9FUNG|nr:hypothetical protein INT48_006627 [Thamnidium elegans]